MVKINFDGNIRAEERKSGIGVVVRDSTGNLLGFCQDIVNGVIEPIIIELYVAIKAIEWGY